MNEEAYVERQIRRFRNALFLGVLFFVLSETAAALHIVTSPHKLVWDYLTKGNPFLASGFLGAFVIFALTQPGRRAVTGTLLLGVGLESIVGFQRMRGGESLGHVLANVGGGMGLAGVIGAWVRYRRAPLEEKRRRLQILLACGVTPTFLVLSNTFLELTVTFHPLTFDSYVYTGDNAFGFQPSFALAVWGNRFPALIGIISLVYVQLPAAFAVIFALETRQRVKDNDVLSAFLFAGFLGFACYHALPLVGPRYAFEEIWPQTLAAPDVFERALLRPVLVFRNCVPSLHTTWALLLFWYARPLPRRIRIYAFVWLVLTELATLALGYHFLLDLVIATPFACFVQGLASSKVPIRTPQRSRALVYGGVATVGWFLLVRFGSDSFLKSPPLVVSVAVLTVIASFVIESDLASLPGQVTAPVETRYSVPRPAWLAFGATAAAVLARGLCADWLATAHDISRTTMGLVWLAGVAVGLVFRGVGETKRVFVRVQLFSGVVLSGLGVLAFLLFSTLVGTGPVMALFVLPLAVATGLALMPLARTHFVAIAAGGAAGLALDLFFAPRLDAWPRLLLIVAMHVGLARWAGRGMPEPEPSVAVPLRGAPAAFLGGLASLLGLVAIVHLLGVAFPFASTKPGAWLAIALSVLLGLFVGTGARKQGVPAGWVLGLGLGALSFALLATPFFVQELSPYLATFGNHYPTRDFDQRAFVRLSLGLVVVAGPGVSIGAALSTVVHQPAPFWRGNVAGWVFGATLAVFTIALIGSLRTLQAAALVSAVSAVYVLIANEHWRALPYLAMVVLGVIAQPRIFDWTKLAGGGSITFDTSTLGPASLVREDIDLGAVTLHDQRDEAGDLVRTVAVNGQPRGTTGRPGLGRFALNHAHHRAKALVLGIGNGATIDELSQAGVAVDVVESSRAILELSTSAFDVPVPSVQYGSTLAYVARSRATYDIETLELPNLRSEDGAAWLSIERLGGLIARLNDEEGVVAMRIGLSPLDRRDVTKVLGTFRAAFTETWLYAVPTEAVIVGCWRACPPRGDGPAVLVTLSPADVDRLLSEGPREVLTAGNVGGLEHRAPIAPAPWPSDGPGEAFAFIASRANH